MRNLKKYQITMEEVVIALDTAFQRASDDDEVGSIDAFILGRILEMAQNNMFQPEDFEE